MGERQSKEERLIALTCALFAAPRFGLTKEQLVLAVKAYSEAAPGAGLDKMFERDKSELRTAGIEIETLSSIDSAEDNSQARYRIPSGSFEWPESFELNQPQLQLLELAARAWNNQSMSAAAAQGITRLKSLGLVSASTQPQVFSARLVARDPAFEPLSLAVAERKEVSFRYQKPDGALSDRLVQPWRLRNLDGQWVLLALDSKDDTAKNFMLRRIHSRVQVLDSQFNSPSAESVNVAERELEAFIETNRAEIAVQPNSEAWMHFGLPEQVAGLEIGDEMVVKFGFMDAALLAEDLMEYGSQVSVIAPPHLVAAVASGFGAVIDAHAKA